MQEQPEFRYIDIFAGCGGLSLGLHNAGWKGVFAIEKNADAFKTLRYNLISKKNQFDWPSWLEKKEYDINDILQDNEKELKEIRGTVHLVAGGPPCQGFSTAGKRNKNDLRNKLVDSYVKFIEKVMPRAVFFENVKGFTMSFEENGCRDEAYSNYVEGKLKGIGYTVHHDVIDFSEYGIPQSRKRFILIGVLNGDPKKIFEQMAFAKDEFLLAKGLKPHVTLREAISDLERRHGEVNSEESNHFFQGKYGKVESNYQKYLRNSCNRNEFPDSHRYARHKKSTIDKFEFILRNCERNKNIARHIKNQFGTNKKCLIALNSESPSPTLTTLPDDYIHYTEPRILTVREYARIQSFNDWFEIKGRYTTGGKNRVNEVPRYTQIGNAIPPLFVELFGTVLIEYLNKFT